MTSWWGKDVPQAGTTETQDAAWPWEHLGTPPRGPEEKAAAARAEAERRELELEEAFASGRAEGLREGQQRARTELAEALTAVRAAVAAVEAYQEERTEELEAEVLALALGVARHVVERELRQDVSAYADLVRRALASFPLNVPLKVRVNPEDLSRISGLEAAHGDAGRIAGTRDVRWMADPAVGAGGCVVEGPDKVVDGRVDEALERVYWEVVRGG